MINNKQGLASSDALVIINPGSSNLKIACLSKTDPAFEVQCQYENGSLKDNISAFLLKYPAAFCCVRFVHGGPSFARPALVDNKVFAELEKLVDFAPLHNPISIDCLRVLLEHFPSITPIAMFDTEFFEALPAVAQAYGLSKSLQSKHQLRRFGFHGFAHAGMLNEWQHLAPEHKTGSSRIVTIQLGSGCSMAAIEDAKAIETSMGFTPNDGLLMSTRSGDIDAGLVTWLQKQEHWTSEQTDVMLNHQSGWSGMSELGSNMSDLLQSDSSQAVLAVSLFCYRIRKTLGAYFAILGKLDGIIFSGGIAEHSPAFCLRILHELEHLGIKTISESALSQLPVETLHKNAIRISSEHSQATCWVVSAKENTAMLASLLHSGLTKEVDK